VLEVRDPPASSIAKRGRIVPSFAFVTPVMPRTGNGFAMTMAVRVRDCDQPVDVTLRIAGTAEFWGDQRRVRTLLARRTVPPATRRNLVLERDAPVIVSYFGAPLLNVHVGPAANLAEVEEDPPVPRRMPSKFAFARPSDLQPIAVGRGEGVVRAGILSNGQNQQLGYRFRNWIESRTPILVSFRSEWLTPRSPGSCYLRLPALVGSDTVDPAVRAEEAAHLSRFSAPAGFQATNRARTEYGTTEVIAPGALRSDLSVPPPDDYGNRGWTWACTSGERPKPATKGLDLETPGFIGASGGTFRYPPLPREAPVVPGVQHREQLAAKKSCASIAVVEEPSAEKSRNLRLLLVGAGLSLGLFLVFEEILSLVPRRKRLASDSPE